MRSRVARLAAITAALAACARAAAQPVPTTVPPAGEEAAAARAERGQAGRFRFVDAAPASGLKRVLWYGRPGKDHLLDSAGAGCAFIDFDRDGRLDVYLVNGWRLDGSRVVERGKNALYRGTAGAFEDVTEKAGCGGEGHWGAGVAAADYDGDGWTDILVTNFGPNVLYRNRGDGTFENVAARLGVEAPGWNAGAAFFDADGDGDLDLYVARYIKCTLDEVLGARRTLDWKGVAKVAFGPFGLTGEPDIFFRAEKGRFADATAEAGLEDRALAYGFGVRAADFDADGDVDLYVANDSDANYLYRNEGKGVFREIGVWSGCALDGGGAAQASMGVAAGDIDGDGNLDIYVTNFAEDQSTLYRGLGDAMFEDATAAANLKEPTYMPLSWGTVMCDLDADGDLDIVEAAGHIYPQVDEHPAQGQTYGQRNLLLENQAGKFTDVAKSAGPGFETALSSRGLVAGDADNDGDVDLLVTRLDAPPALLRNEGPQGAWLIVQLEDARGPISAPGTRMTVTAGGRSLVRDACAGESYCSTGDPRPHFGLGKAESAEKVEIRWPGGASTVLKDVPARQILRVRRP